jgi:hypothetical protein
MGRSPKKPAKKKTAPADSNPGSTPSSRSRIFWPDGTITLKNSIDLDLQEK